MGVDAEMFVRVPRVLTDVDVRAASVKMCIALGAHRFWVWPPDEHYPQGKHALQICPRAKDLPKEDRYEARSSLRTRKKEETLIECNLSGRYYGPDYERGDLVSIAAVARYLQHIYPDGVVLYGGDSSEEKDEWTPEFEASLWDHLHSEAGRDYFQSWNSTFASSGAPAVSCSFCGIDAICNGGGPDKTIHYCPSCHQAWDRAKISGKVTPRKEGRESESKIASSRAMMDSALDSLAKVALGVAEITTLHIRQDSTDYCVSSPYQAISPERRIEIYERAGTALLEEVQRLLGKAKAE